MDKAKCIRVNFFLQGSDSQVDEREYDYLFDGKANVGDLAVVRVDNSRDFVYKVVGVKQVFGRKTQRATKYAIAVFSEEAAKEARERAARQEELLEEMRARRIAAREMQEFENLADGDDVMKSLIEEFRSLKKED